MLSGVFSSRRVTCAKVTGAPSGWPSAAKRVTVCASILRERADGERRPLGELAEAAAQDAAPLGQHADRHAGARRVVHAFDDVVAIGAEAQLEHQPIVDAPAILREHGELGRR